MTTFTTEDRINASPPHIVDSGASVKTLADFIEQETRVEMLRQQMQSSSSYDAPTGSTGYTTGYPIR